MIEARAVASSVPVVDKVREGMPEVAEWTALLRIESTLLMIELAA